MDTTHFPVFTEAYKPSGEYNIRSISPHWKLGIHSQFQHIDWLDNIHNHPVVEMHQDLAKKYKIQDKRFRSCQK